MDNERILVVGTTPDYIDWIRRLRPGGALFITDPLLRHNAEELSPGPDEELLTDLSDFGRVLGELDLFLGSRNLCAVAVVCFDCESMGLAARIAEALHLPFPSVRAVENCRDKSAAKRFWQEGGVPCPRGALVRSEREAARFFTEESGPCVLKPLTGSGSELVFRCDGEEACRAAFRTLFRGLSERTGNRLFAAPEGSGTAVLAEAFVRGEEFSCDFVLDKGEVRILRIARKIPDGNGSFGTVSGYVVPGELPSGISLRMLRELMGRSAGLLGLERAVCMADFMATDGKLLLLELSPRPGGDCLPHLLMRSAGMDMLSLTLDFARGKEIREPQWEKAIPHAGLRIPAREGGILRRIDAHRLLDDARVCEIHLPRKGGHRVRMPPLDYDTRWLGHVIFRPHGEDSVEAQCRELLSMVKIEMIQEERWTSTQ